MKPIHQFFLISLLLFIGGVLQQSTLSTVSIFGICPQFLVAFAAAICFFLSPTGCLFVGFFAGFIQGSLAGSNLTAYIISFIIGCYFISFVKRLELEMNVIVAGFFSICMAFLTQTVLLFLAPPSLILTSLGTAAGSAVYDGVISLLLYSLLLKAFMPKTAWQ